MLREEYKAKNEQEKQAGVTLSVFYPLFAIACVLVAVLWRYLAGDLILIRHFLNLHSIYKAQNYSTFVLYKALETQHSLKQQIAESVTAIRIHTTAKPKVGVILGTGLGHLATEVEVQTVIPYQDIPNMPHSTVETHAGRLLFGTLADTEVVVMQGRFHYYEGYSMKQITHGVRIMKALGVETLVVSNACGAMNPQFRRSDIMIITDHINLIGDNPLIGPNDNELGPRFPDMSEPYTASLIDLAEQCALEQKVKEQKGVYVAVAGPNLETRAEYRFLRAIGADVVGMSTVPEVIVAVHAGMKVLGISVITDECFPDALQAVSLPEILEAAAVAEPKMTIVLKEVLKRL